MTVRVKWFVPGNGDHPFKPFGIDSAGATVQFARRSCNDSLLPTDVAGRDHMLWPILDRRAQGSGCVPRSARGETRP